jgi:hypothetical protein
MRYIYTVLPTLNTQEERVFQHSPLTHVAALVTHAIGFVHELLIDVQVDNAIVGAAQHEDGRNICAQDDR